MGKNGWLVSTTSQRNKPSNRAVVETVERFGLASPWMLAFRTAVWLSIIGSGAERRISVPR
jgi:hypothetical protein